MTSQRKEVSKSKSEARKRSVDNLQRLYTVVVSLAITEILRRFFSNVDLEEFKVSSTQICALVTFLITIIPFYHGANRYLDDTYVLDERKAKYHALLVDFVFLFVEGLLFFALAMMFSRIEYFYTVLSILFILDIVWVGSTNLTASKTDKMPRYRLWAILNAIAMVLILVFVWSNLTDYPFWPTVLSLNIALMAVAIMRSVLDYILVWNFYYPKEETGVAEIPLIGAKKDFGEFPAPPPARPPQKDEEEGEET